jgi:hypothetical protein
MNERMHRNLCCMKVGILPGAGSTGDCQQGKGHKHGARQMLF